MYQFKIPANIEETPENKFKYNPCISSSIARYMFARFGNYLNTTLVSVQGPWTFEHKEIQANLNTTLVSVQVMLIVF